MRIAQVAPLHESVPPRLYGGTERIVSYLTEELVRRGHDVTLYATADSRTDARLVPMAESGLRLAGATDPVAPHVAMVERVFAEADRYDLIHFHVDYLHFPVARRAPVPHLTTLHGRLDLPELRPLYALYPDMPLVSISNAQRLPLPFVRWEATVHHGLPLDLYEPAGGGPGDYLAFLGRLSPEKGGDRAIEIAQRAGRLLKVAGKVDRADAEHFERVVRPLMDQGGVEFCGELGDREKNQLLGGARALLFPIDWPEPFGMVMIEAMASGTPVIAFRRGSVPEVMEHGVTGFVVDDVEGALRALERVPELDRGRIRGVFERRFSAERMAADYLKVYERLARYRPFLRGSRPRLLHPPKEAVRQDGQDEGADGHIGPVVLPEEGVA